MLPGCRWQCAIYAFKTSGSTTWHKLTLHIQWKVLPYGCGTYAHAAEWCTITKQFTRTE
jgi:hypothetical protein